MSALRIAYAAILAALAGAVGSWLAIGIYALVTDLQVGRSLVPDPVEIVRAFAILVVVGVPSALPLTACAAVVALRLQRRGVVETSARERYPMRTRFVLGCAAAGGLWEAATWMLLVGEVRAKLVVVGGPLGLAAGVAGGWVLWRWSQRVVSQETAKA